MWKYCTAGFKQTIFAAFILIVSCIHGTQYCQDSACTDGNCPITECDHGICDDSGNCQCLACWTGESCQLSGTNAPRFEQHVYEVMISEPIPADQPIAQVSAVDDIYLCEGFPDCPCAEIEYAIRSGNNQGFFSIKPDTGEIYFTGNRLISRKHSYTLEVAARNHEYNGILADRSVAKVVIKLAEKDLLGMNKYAGFQAEYQDIQHSEAIPQDMFQPPVHSRSKRDINTNLSSYGPRPIEVMFHMEKLVPYSNVTEMFVSDKIHFLLAIQFPVNTTDMLVELFTPDNTTTVMILCNVVVEHWGSRLTTTMGAANVSTFEVVMDAREEGVYYYDRAIIDFGNVTNLGSATSGTEEMVIIEWDAIMVENADTQDAGTYWVSAGAEYNNDTEIWIGQTSFTVQTDEHTTTDQPIFNFTGPCDVQLDATAEFILDMYVPHRSAHVIVEAHSPPGLSSHVSPCSVLIVDAGSRYSCVPKDYITYRPTAGTGCTNCNEIVTIDLGTLTNPGRRTDGSWAQEVQVASKLTLAFTFYVYNSTAAVGDTYQISTSVQIDDIDIYSSGMNLTVIDSRNSTGLNGQTPSPRLVTLTPDGVIVGQSVAFELTLNVPTDTEALYILETLAAFNNSARMRICELSVLRRGINIPCFTDREPEYSSRDGSNVNDRAVWNLGLLRNTGHRNIVVDTTANEIVFRIVASVLEHNLNTPGETLWLTVGLDFNDDILWVGSNAITINETLTNPGTPPEFSLSFSFGDGTVAVGASAEIELNITSQLGTVHNLMDMEIFMPFANNAPMLKIYQIIVTHVGKNLPCVDMDAVNEMLELYSRVNTSVLDVYDPNDPLPNGGARVSLGTVCTTALGTSLNEDDDRITLKYVVQLLNHTNVTEGWTDWLSDGVQYADNFIWVGQIELTATMAEQSLSSGSPFFVATFFGNETAASPGFDLGTGKSERLTLLLKLPPRETTNLVLTAEVQSGMSVCFLRVVRFGSGYPCMTTDIPVTNTTFSDDTFNTESMSIDFGAITNLGKSNISETADFDENTIELELVVKMLEATTAPVTLTLTVTCGASSTPLVITVIPFDPTTDVVSLDEVDFSPAAISHAQTPSADIAMGQTLLFHLDINIPEETDYDYTVKFIAPVNMDDVLEICSLSVIYVGANLPCVRQQGIDDEPTSREGSTFTSTRTLSLGHICQINLVNETNANLLRIEGAVRALRSSDLITGDMITLSATINTNDQQILVSQLNLTLTDSFTPVYGNQSEATFILDNGLDSSLIRAGPGDIVELPLLITFPAYSSQTMSLEVQTTVSTSAEMTVHHIEVNSSGTNLGCMADNWALEFYAVYYSNQSTTQHDNLEYDFGIVTNTGTTYRKNVFQEADNQLSVLVQLQMTDAQENNDSHSCQVTFTLTLGEGTDQILLSINKTIQVARTLHEVPDIILEATMINNITYGAGDLISIEAKLQHTNLSQAEGYNTTAAFYFPSFMRFIEITANNFTDPTIYNTTTFAGIRFEFERLLFTDIASFNFTLEVIDDVVPFAELEFNSTTPYEAGSNIISRDSHVNVSGTWFVSRIDQLSYQIVAGGSAECTPVALGMAGEDILDCQLSSSQSAADTSTVRDARYITGSGWHVGIRSGSFLPYIQVFFGNVTLITGATIAHDTSATCRATAVEFLYGDDGIVWTSTQESITLTAATETITAPSGVEGRYVQLRITNNNCATDVPIITVEFHGCSATGRKTVSEVCAAANTPWGQYNAATELYTRGALTTSTHRFYCDENPTTGKHQCFYSLVTEETTWYRVNEVVMNILGLNTETNQLFGIAWDQRSFMMSDDGGISWYSVAYSRYQEASTSATWVGATALPWHIATDFNPSATTGAYTYYGVNSDSANTVATWNTCCV